MSCRRNLSRVCCLINTSLHPFMELDSTSLTKESEKDVLIVLSKVLKQIQLLGAGTDDDDDDDDGDDDDDDGDDDYDDGDDGDDDNGDNDYDDNDDGDDDYDDGDDGDDDDDSDASVEGLTNCSNHHRLTKVIANLIVFLTAESSKFVQHSACNVLVAVSKCATFSGDDWKCFIGLLCACLELAVSSSLSRPSVAGAEVTRYDHVHTFNALIKPMLAVANWSTVSCITLVLRNILKYLKQDYDDQFVVIYLDCASSCLSNIPFDLLNDIEFHGEDSLSISLFLGNLVQFLCSLVGQSCLTEANQAISEPPNSCHPIADKINNLVPGILRWCLGKLEGRNNMYISSYLTHKLLMLMIRLGSRISLNNSMIVTWLQLLHKYFRHLLLQSLTQLKYGGEDCLEGSPFASSLCDGDISSMGTRHLQRQAIFLFLRCSFYLIGSKEEIAVECACVDFNSCSPYDLSLNPECCSKKKGLLELYHWLEGLLPSNMFGDDETYKEKCTGFVQSFLRLYMNEDDILFEVLLQLFSINTYCPKRSFYEDQGTWKDVKKDILQHIANIFHPIRLFHLFLAELHYDHQVLLDYLISKDTGISCAEYLLRCLRAICDSWNLFEEFSWGEKDLSGSSCKKRKLNVDAPNSTVKGEVAVSLSNEEHGNPRHTPKEKSFKEAKKCLLSLKSSIENLRQKKLFPYNPEVLLRRLRRFEELCLKVNNI